MARCNRCNKFMLIASKSGYCKGCNIIVIREQEERLKQMKEAEIQRNAEEERLRQESERQCRAEEERRCQEETEKQRREEEERKCKEAEKSASTKTVESELYPWIPEIKKLFEPFIPIFQQRVTIDENAWQRINTSHMTWAHDALDLKRQGKYLEACKLYFTNIPLNGSCSMGWAQGVFKTLAVAGDIEDALAFGNAWVIKNGVPDMLAVHWATLQNMCGSKDTLDQIPDYLKSISGNPSYTVDLHKTDLYSSASLIKMRK